jgi:hypothetical protein
MQAMIDPVRTRPINDRNQGARLSARPQWHYGRRGGPRLRGALIGKIAGFGTIRHCGGKTESPDCYPQAAVAEAMISGSVE